MDQYPASPQKRTFALGELVDMIIDQLAEDQSSLKYCSLLSKQWVPRCRYHLLKVVAFVDSPPGHSLERWCATFGATNGMQFPSLCVRYDLRRKRFPSPDRGNFDA